MGGVKKNSSGKRQRIKRAKTARLTLCFGGHARGMERGCGEEKIIVFVRYGNG
jgi:hypothetical protein